MIHPASLVDGSTHPTPLLRLLSLDINAEFIKFTIKLTTHVVEYAMLSESLPSDVPATQKDQERCFIALVQYVLSRAEITTSTLLTALVYIKRVKRHLKITMRKWALERVFLGSMIVAYKYINDTHIRNADWARCSGVFGNRDIGRIEREFLDVVDWDLRVTEGDILSLYSDSHEAGKLGRALGGRKVITPACASSTPAFAAKPKMKPRPQSSSLRIGGRDKKRAARRNQKVVNKTLG